MAHTRVFLISPMCTWKRLSRFSPRRCGLCPRRITIEVGSSGLFDLWAQFFSPRSFEEKLSHLRKQAAFKTEATAGELEAVRTAIADNEKQWKEVLATTLVLHHHLGREALCPPYTHTSTISANSMDLWVSFHSAIILLASSCCCLLLLQASERLEAARAAMDQLKLKKENMKNRIVSSRFCTPRRDNIRFLDCTS